ncbi:MAG: AAA family ATPase [Acidobacteriota bacterium]
MNDLRQAVHLPATPEGDRRLSKLSRGELQRVGLDIALGIAPEVLLLDEPWTGLEPDARIELSERIKAAASGRVIICSSHDLDEVARLADDVVFLGRGVGTWRSREEAFDRDELMRLYRETRPC